MNLLIGRIEQEETLAGAVDAEHPAGRAGADQQLAVVIECQRHRMRRFRGKELLTLAVGRDLVDGALVTSAGEYITGAVHDKRPDVLVVGIEKRGGLTLGVDTIDPPIGRGTDKQAAARRRRQRVYFQFVA